MIEVQNCFFMHIGKDFFINIVKGDGCMKLRYGYVLAIIVVIMISICGYFIRTFPSLGLYGAFGWPSPSALWWRVRLREQLQRLQQLNV